MSQKNVHRGDSNSSVSFARPVIHELRLQCSHDTISCCLCYEYLLIIIIEFTSTYVKARELCSDFIDRFASNDNKLRK